MVGFGDWGGEGDGGGLLPDVGEGERVEVADEEPAEGEHDQFVEEDGGARHADVGEPAGDVGGGPKGVLGEGDGGEGDGEEEGEEEEELHPVVEVSKEGFLDDPTVHAVGQAGIPQIKDNVNGVGEPSDDLTGLPPSLPPFLRHALPRFHSIRTPTIQLFG